MTHIGDFQNTTQANTAPVAQTFAAVDTTIGVQLLWGQKVPPATAKVSIAGTFTGLTVTWQYLSGADWITAPYGTRIDVPSGTGGNGTTGNPSVAANSSGVAAAASTWEVPLPANAQGLRAIVSAIATGSATITVGIGRMYVPGVPVTAVLFDASDPGGTTGTGLNTGTLDISGWTSVTARIFSPTGQVWTIYAVDDTGALIQSTNISGTASSNSAISIARGGASGALASSTIGAGLSYAVDWVERRIQGNLPTGGSVSVGRCRILVAR
jgi:hypothetical protein